MMNIFDSIKIKKGVLKQSLSLWLVLVALIFSSSTTVLANEDNKQLESAQKLVLTLGEEAIAIISDNTLDQSAVTEKFNQLLNRYFGMKTIGRFVLGRHWNNATEEQRKDYFELFQSSISKIYAQRFADYTDEKFEVTGGFTKTKKDSVVTSKIIFQGNRPPVNLEWRVRESKSGPKIIDVAIEGVSMSITQRSDFDSIIQRGNKTDIAALIDHLREKQ